MNPTKKSFQTLKAREGEKIGVSDWFLVDQKTVNEFAALTQDYQFIHHMNNQE